MLTFTETRLSAAGVQSLVWDGSALIDWVAGGRRHLLDGEVVPSGVRYAYPFDSAVSLPNSPYAAIYASRQTKALVLRDGEMLRELNRSYYQADEYEYPILMFRSPSGRELLAHCPDDYCCLQIEDLATGEVLTRHIARKPSDFFHSRLIASPGGRFLASAGWLWHPVDDVRLYSVDAALSDPRHLDDQGLGITAWADESSAVFLPDGRLLVALYGVESDEVDATREELTEIRIFEPSRPQDPVFIRTPGRLGTVVPVGNRHVLALHSHPRLIDLGTGQVVQNWPHIASGHRTSSIFGGSGETPAMAFDAARRRYAFADGEGITVLQFSSE